MSNPAGHASSRKRATATHCSDELLPHGRQRPTHSAAARGHRPQRPTHGRHSAHPLTAYSRGLARPLAASLPRNASLPLPVVVDGVHQPLEALHGERAFAQVQLGGRQLRCDSAQPRCHVGGDHSYGSAPRNARPARRTHLTQQPVPTGRRSRPTCPNRCYTAPTRKEHTLVCLTDSDHLLQ